MAATLEAVAAIEREHFAARGDYGGGSGGYDASKSNQFNKDWSYIERDPKDLWTFESSRILARTEDLIRNNPYAVAMSETIISGALGSTGLAWRSSFQMDPNGEPTEADHKIRYLLDAEVRGGMAGVSFDAAGILTKRDMSVCNLSSVVNAGDGIAIRAWKPKRAGVHTHATCWRIIHASRLVNQGFAGNNDKLYEGFELDDDGSPVAAWILKSHPASLQDPSTAWFRIPIFGPDGIRNVTHTKSLKTPDAIRGIGWMAPILGLLNHLGKTEEAYVLAKRIQSCNAVVIEVDDPVKAAGADQKGAILGPNTKLAPGRIYYVKKGSAVKFLNGQYSGQDYDQFQQALLVNFCAALGFPVDYVTKQLTRSNLASARAALMQAWATSQIHQDMLISHAEQPWVESLIYESFTRGRIPGITRDQLNLAYRGTFTRPPQAFPDPAKEVIAATGWVALGGSLTTAFAQNGKNFEDEVKQRARDERILLQQGVIIDPLKILDAQIKAAAAPDLEADAEGEGAPAKKTPAPLPAPAQTPGDGE